MTSQCNGICVRAYEIGMPGSGIAIAHPDCEEHGQTPTRGDGQGWVDQPPPVAASAGRPALDRGAVMPARNKQLARVRLWLHDQVCASECVGDRAYDHARRTQHERARTIVDAPDDDTRRRAIHDALCIHALRGAKCYAQHSARPLDLALSEIREALTVGTVAR